ncbi:MAG: hypothetical protein ACTSQE_04260 [Candidatus Heimdallarchaeaceae archaeon]
MKIRLYQEDEDRLSLFEEVFEYSNTLKILLIGKRAYMSELKSKDG